VLVCLSHYASSSLLALRGQLGPVCAAHGLIHRFPMT
jgi:hypothetical protein